MTMPSGDLTILEPRRVNAREFVHIWSPFYNCKLERLYLENISRALDADRLLALFEWKNGERCRKLSDFIAHFGPSGRSGYLAFW